MWALGVELRCLQGKCFICPFLVYGLVVLTQPLVGLQQLHIQEDCRVGSRWSLTFYVLKLLVQWNTPRAVPHASPFVALDY